MTSYARAAAKSGTAAAVPYARHAVTEADIQAVVEVLRSDWLTTGPEVEAFESDFARYAGSRHAVAFSSATAALHACVSASGVGEGDEGIVSPITFCATANCLLYERAKPVFADVEADTLTLDPEQIRRRITPRTKAILPTDYAGQPALLEEIRTIADDRGLTVIEDAAHALGASLKGKRVGGISHLTVFSFHPVKHITTGEGGMATTDDAHLAARLRAFRNHGIVRDPAQSAREPWYYEMRSLGWNYRLSDIACALGRSQLARIAENLRRRAWTAAGYARALGGIDGLRLPHARQNTESAWHLYPVRADADRLGIDRKRLFQQLVHAGIRPQVHYIPVHLHPYYRKALGTGPGDCPVAEQAYAQLLSLPLFHGMTDADAQRVVDAMRDALGGGR